jgi:hypothetical protein
MTADEATVEDWCRLFSSLHADGGCFARHSTYGLFLNDESRVVKSDNAGKAPSLELAGDLPTRSKEEMKRLLDGQIPCASAEKFQLDLEL